MTRVIEQRKLDHLLLAQDKRLNFSISAGFERWAFIHNALPELNYADIDTSVEFLGKTLKFPLLISSMSGGAAQSRALNARLAEAAERLGCGLALGSIRAALEDEGTSESFLIARQTAPSALILANLGIAQAINGVTMDRTAAFCDKLQADGLILHLNSLQEVFQPEGEPEFKGALAAIQLWVKEFELPIIVKEVGQGLSVSVIKRLEDVGVKYIDIAGAGGSNWVTIEGERLGSNQSTLKETSAQFANWGEPTASVLEKLNTPLTVIASGGLKEPLDFPKSLALGANIAGIAGALLKLAMKTDVEALVEYLQVWQETLKVAMFGVGVCTPDDLVGNRQLLRQID